jgi:beta-galactosidase
MGNEAGNGVNFYSSYRAMKARDNTRPVQYERATHGWSRSTRFEWNSDVLCPMYARPMDLQTIVENDPTRPLILCEYAHAMGNSVGNFQEYWDEFYGHPRMQGGFIWDWVDQALFKVTSSGDTIYAYGGDFGGPDVPSDNNFLCNGVVQPDRSPNPHYWEIKKVHQEVKTEILDGSTGKIAISNLYSFINLSHLFLDWEIIANGTQIAEGRLEDLKVNPGETKNINLNFNLNQKPGTEYFLNIYYKTKKAMKGIPAHYSLAEEQFPIKTLAHLPSPITASTGELKVLEDDQFLVVEGNNLKLMVDKSDGGLASYVYEGTEYIKKDLLPNFWRPLVDNDFGARLQTKLEVWKNPCKGSPLVTNEKMTNGRIKVKVHRSCLDNNADVDISYTIHPDGAILVFQSMDTYGGDYPMLLKFGMNVSLPKEFDQMVWYGRGPHESYADRKTSAFIGRYSGSVSDQFHPYVRPQETGNKTDVRWMYLSRTDGSGLIISGNQALSMSAWHYDIEDLDPGEKGQTHHGELNEKDHTTLNIDLKQMGVGGDNSWGAQPMDKYQLPYQPYAYGFWIHPVTEKDSLDEALKKIGYQ